MPELKFGATRIPYELIHSRRYTIGIEVHPGRVVVRAPQHAPRERLEGFLQSKGAWILRQLQHFEQMRLAYPPRQFVSGERFPFLGEEYSLEVALNGHADPYVNLGEGRLLVCVSAGLSPEAHPECVREALRAWYQERAKAILPVRAHELSRQVGLAPEKVRVRTMLRRWGSCTARGTVNLSWLLTFAPQPIIDYVIIHELCHLKHLNHSAGFWRLVESQVPDYKARRKWLRLNGRFFNIYLQ
jgi:predicted metal-dependent hydrolase